MKESTDVIEAPEVHSKEEMIVITGLTQEKYAIAKSPKTFEEFAAQFEGWTAEQLIKVCFMRTRTCKIFMQRTEDAHEVIDLIAEELDLTDKGHFLYGAYDGQTPIVEKIQQYSQLN